MLCLECIKNWARRYYKIYKLEEYKKCYESLLSKKIFINHDDFYFNDYYKEY
jgi:hypothetical protein